MRDTLPLFSLAQVLNLAGHLCNLILQSLRADRQTERRGAMKQHRDTHTRGVFLLSEPHINLCRRFHLSSSPVYYTRLSVPDKHDQTSTLHWKDDPEKKGKTQKCSCDSFPLRWTHPSCRQKSCGADALCRISLPESCSTCSGVRGDHRSLCSSSFSPGLTQIYRPAPSRVCLRVIQARRLEYAGSKTLGGLAALLCTAQRLQKKPTEDREQMEKHRGRQER